MTSLGGCLRRLMTDYHQAALTVHKRHLGTGRTGPLTDALQRVIAEPRFKQQVAKLAARLRAHPGTPLSRVGLLCKRMRPVTVPPPDAAAPTC